MSEDIDCVITGKGTREALEETLNSLTKVKYFRGKVHSYVVGQWTDLPSEIHAIEEKEGSLTKGRNLGWGAGESAFVQFLEVGDRLNPDWFQRAAKELLGGASVVCGRIVPANPDVNRYHRIAYLESKIDLDEGALLDIEPLLWREVLEETGGYNESLSKGGSLEYNARLAEKKRPVLHLNFPMVTRIVAILNWKAYWRQSVEAGYRIAAAASKRRRLSLDKELLTRAIASFVLVLVAIFGLFVSAFFLLLLLPAAIILLQPRIFKVEKIAKQEGFSHEDAALYTWHKSLSAIPHLWGVIRFWLHRIFR